MVVRTPEKDAHICVFSSGCKEIERHLIFRDRLRANASERDIYAETKRRLAARDWPDMNAYADAKTGIIEEIIGRGRKSMCRHRSGDARGLAGPARVVSSENSRAMR
jgi:GrpB-like predicted nucleotidyltransferase (UPF0157 family)